MDNNIRNFSKENIGKKCIISTEDHLTYKKGTIGEIVDVIIETETYVISLNNDGIAYIGAKYLELIDNEVVVSIGDIEKEYVIGNKTFSLTKKEIFVKGDNKKQEKIDVDEDIVEVIYEATSVATDRMIISVLCTLNEMQENFKLLDSNIKDLIEVIESNKRISTKGQLGQKSNPKLAPNCSELDNIVNNYISMLFPNPNNRKK